MYGKMSHVQVSDEYLETVCKWLEKWTKESDSWIVAQFLKKYGIGWSYFKHFLTISPKLKNIFEVTVATLCERWVMYAMERKDLPKHMAKLVLRYIKVYDNHAYDQELEAKKELAREETTSALDYVKEDYAREQLEGVFKRIYELNSDKRRGKSAS